MMIIINIIIIMIFIIIYLYYRYRSGSRLVEESGGRLRVRTGVQEGGRKAISILTIDEVNR